MADAATIVLTGAGFALLGGFAVFGVVSVQEGEPRAARVAFALAIGCGLPFFLAVSLPDAGRFWVALGVVSLVVLALVSWFLPIGASTAGNGRPSRRVDERDIMFARARLKPGSPQYEAYYSMRPQNRAGDDKTRSLPGLLSPDARKADPVAFASAEASFATTEALRHYVDGPVAKGRRQVPPREASAMVKGYALYHGARDAGVCEVRPRHVYTHVGRGTGTYGEPVLLDHGWAVAFTVEMDHAVMRCAPEGPVVAESARQYVCSAVIAIQLAAMIRELGYSARAHIDGNYRVIAPLVAVDAGLGEIGRMGLVMTPRLGPRVRLGVVTTDLRLEPDPPGDDAAVIDFCEQCEKCAENCPPNAIPFGPREPVDEGLRWAIDADACFRYWNAIGTDCGRCMTVCPYSHPESAAHDLVRWAVARSGAARRVMLWMDDLFYGRQPRPARVPTIPGRSPRSGSG
jgi:ferredoxin